MHLTLQLYKGSSKTSQKNHVMRYTDEEKTAFESRLAEVKARLKQPQFKSYGAVLVATNPEMDFKLRQIYNVIHCGTKNLQVLEALERMVGIEQAAEVA